MSNWWSESWQLCICSNFKMKGWVLDSAVGAAAIGVRMGRGGWAKILPKLTAAREGSWDAEGAWDGGAACVWDVWLPSCCLLTVAVQGDVAHVGELVGCRVPPAAPRASGHKMCIRSSCPAASPTLQSWRSVAWCGFQGHPAFATEAFHKPASPLCPQFP